METINHWLYGDKEFKLLVKKEVRCNYCIHREVCYGDKEKRCINYQMSTSQYSGCCGCINRFTRDDEKQPIPCFHCNWFKKITINKYIFKDFDEKYEKAYLPAHEYKKELPGWIEVTLKENEIFITDCISDINYDDVILFIKDNCGKFIFHLEEDEETPAVYLDFLKVI